ncbi:MAG TPA: polyprenyl synthetase family protein [Desulfobacteraceae bacterium]|nr:polyprenyl synthetase family protein [Desulfobacteraceae bacterium]
MCEPELKKEFQPIIFKIEESLKRNVHSQISITEDMVRYGLLGSGKRLRPLLFILSYRLFEMDDNDDLYDYSIIFEFIHTASLFHDDVIDNSEYRRKKPSVKKIWGNNAAILGGDFLFSRALEIAVRIKNSTFLEIVAQTTTRMAEGQVLELVNIDNMDLTEQEYLRIVRLKTAFLISCACTCGAILAGAKRGLVEHVSEFGINMGMAFQLVDDILDFTGSIEDMGKPPLKDIKEGKITLPVIYTLAQLVPEERDRFRKIFFNARDRQYDFEYLIGVIRKKGGIEKTLNVAHLYIERAKKELRSLPDSYAKLCLKRLCNYILHRRH